MRLLVRAAFFCTLLASLVQVLLGTQVLFWITDWFTTQILDLVTYPPVALDYSLRVHAFPAYLIPLYLFVLFFVTLKVKENFLTAKN